MGSIVALGLGVTFVFATVVIERHLSDQLKDDLPENAPSTFFLDVQPDQWPGLERLLAEEGATGVSGTPVITARFAAIDGVPVADLAAADDGEPSPARIGVGERPRRWALTREQRLTYGPALPRGNRVTEGAFPSGTRGGVSVEEGFAKDLRVHVGSTLSFDVQGVNVDLTVTSLRTVDWRTFGINFFLFAEPGALEDAPQQRIAVARLPQKDLVGTGAKIVRAFPNVTVIHVREVIERVLAVLGELSVAVRSLGGFIVAAGIVVLGGTVTATQARRSREVALLKAIGMTRLDVITVFGIEYALTGLVAAIVGLAAGSALGFVVVSRVLQVRWVTRPLELLAAAGVVVLLAVVAGLAASARALSAPPADVLRGE
jgi:putative ABC transport system permease protein